MGTSVNDGLVAGEEEILRSAANFVVTSADHGLAPFFAGHLYRLECDHHVIVDAAVAQIAPQAATPPVRHAVTPGAGPAAVLARVVAGRAAWVLRARFDVPVRIQTTDAEEEC